MGRVYIELECGCLVSCDGGGGLIPCDFDGINPDCKFGEWLEKHPFCDWCGECLTCHPNDHDECAAREAACGEIDGDELSHE